MVRIKEVETIITTDSIVIVSDRDYWRVIAIDTNIESTIDRGLFAQMDSNAGDILFISRKGFIRKVFTVGSRDNVLFVTEQCNNYCLMCSQPPTNKNDIEFYLKLNRLILGNMSSDTCLLGISGGEPTLLGDNLITLIENVYATNNDIALHLLSNGRNFKDKCFAERFERFGSKDLMIGIPLHSDYFDDHDLIAGRVEAFYDTMQGIYNLALYGVSIEIRVVINKLNYNRLPEIADYIYKNIPFVSHIAFMGMEYTGFALKNMSKVQIEVKHYVQELKEAVLSLSDWRMNVSIYNIPLCLLPNELHSYARKSISDWKEMYISECVFCSLKSECGGVFSTSKFIDTGIHSI